LYFSKERVIKMKSFSNNAMSFSEIKVGYKVEFEIKISEQIHNMFADLSGDNSPVHSDDIFCGKTRYGRRIGYAFLLTSFLSKLYGEYLPGGSSVCIKQDAKFIKPYFIDDVIRISGEVVNISDSTKFIDIKTEMYREENECIFKGLGTVQVAFNKNLVNALYEVDNKNIYCSDIIDSFKKAGLQEGDTIFVHSDISVFGKLKTTDRGFFLEALIDAIKETVGVSGTIIMPTFTYSFCKNETYDVRNSKSDVGTLSEFFRKQSDVIRTNHPIFSVAIWGKNKSKYIDIGRDCFDNSSIFGKLHKDKAKIVFFGAPFNSCTYIHHIEQMMPIKYRYFKTFKGKIKMDDNEYEDEYTYFVRHLDKNVILDTTKLERYLLNNNLMKQAILGNGEILVIDSDLLFDEGTKMLKKFPYFFLKEAPL